MSETYGFGYYDGEAGDPGLEPEVPETGNSTIKALRAKADADSKALKEMRDQIAQLQAVNRQATVREQLQAKGYDPAVATLYQGEPDKVDEWLTTNGGLLARRPEGGEEIKPPAGPPASTVSSEHQEQLRRLQAAGDGAAPAMGSEAELVAALNSAKSIEDFEKVAQANGWQYSTDGLFG